MLNFFSFSFIFTEFFECNVQRCILILTGLVQGLCIYFILLCAYLHVEDMSGTMNSTTKCIASDKTGLSWNMHVPKSR